MAFEAMYRFYFPRLAQFVLRYVKSPVIAEDLVQNVFLYIWRHQEKLRPQESLRAYLFTAAKNQAIDYLRGRQVRDFSEYDSVESLETQTNTPEENYLHEALERAFARAIQQLPERRRMIYLMHREDGLTYQEIAEVLSISVKTVETQMGRTLKFLRNYLSDFLPALGSGILAGWFVLNL